ncbi:carbon-nitrogen family hydrolase [Alkalihalobacillus sp. 1P02AB]|uniref:carbon-nitrogen family hydrolase n=1 Tax=Alkalihalobacillus sp. 1P02AB TaxID=3132260 RepID=UPI0039A4AED5
MLHVACFQMDITPGDPEANRRVVEAWVKEQMTVDENTDVLVLPEMWTTAYRLKDLAKTADTPNGETIQFLSDLAKFYQVNIVGGSIAVKEAGEIYNRALIFNREGELIYEYDKIHLVPMLDEPKYLTGGRQKVESFTLDGHKMGIIICYDLRFPELARSLAVEGVELLFVVAEWPEVRAIHWEVLQQARAIENQIYLISCNRVGEDEGTLFSGRSMFINPWGEVILKGAKDKQETLRAKLELEEVAEIRENVPVFKSRVPHLYK